MTTKGSWISVLAICLLGSYLALANPQGGSPPAGAQGAGRGGAAAGGAGGRGGAGGGAPQAPPQPMSFFVASQGSGKGADLGGLAGADAICQRLAASAGRGDATWHAYMSTQGPGGVNARDRIGNGPWYNQRGQMIARNVADLHGDTLDQARLGNNVAKTSTLTEKGEIVNGVGDNPTRHDMLTGSMPDGRAYPDGDHTCSNYTRSDDVQGVNVQLGHTDRQGGGNNSWNSAHASAGCSQPALVRTGGAGAFYCFAVN
jgi:hypothetical protein